MRLCEISECLLLQFCSMSCRDTARRVRQFQQRDIPLETFHRNVSKIKALQTANRAERSCSLRPRKAVAFLTHLLRAPKSKGAGSFAVCGQRLRGHVPSKNTSPAALSWISLFGATVLKSFCSCPMRSKTKKDTAHRVPSPHRTPQNEKMPESLCFRAFESGDPYGN